VRVKESYCESLRCFFQLVQHECVTFVVNVTSVQFIFSQGTAAAARRRGGQMDNCYCRKQREILQKSEMSVKATANNKCACFYCTTMYISRQGLKADLEFCVHIEGWGPQRKLCKSGSLTVDIGSRDQLLNFGTTPPVVSPEQLKLEALNSACVETRAFQFAIRIDSFCNKNRPFDSLVVM